MPREDTDYDVIFDSSSDNESFHSIGTSSTSPISSPPTLSIKLRNRMNSPSSLPESPPERNSSLKRKASKSALLLGMVYARPNSGTGNSTGQIYRDRVRCVALEHLDYDVKTMDDKHSGDGDEEVENNGDFVAEKGKHLRANFADSSRMMKKMIANWGQTEKLKFDLIVLDYFFCPAGYVQERWKEKFFSESLPLLGQDILTAGGEVWLPNMHYVQTMLDKHRDKLVNWYRWEAVADPNRNPLYQATQLVDHMLNRCPDGRTNETQLSPLKDVSDKVFVVLRRRMKRKQKIYNNINPSLTHRKRRKVRGVLTPLRTTPIVDE